MRRVTGLLVLKDGRIVAEHYRYGRVDTDRFLSFSMAKSITSLLIGIAIEKGLIRCLDDPAEKYVSELKGTGYGLRHGSATASHEFRSQIRRGVQRSRRRRQLVARRTRSFGSEPARRADVVRRAVGCTW